MGLLSDIFGFIGDLTSGSSYYKENSIEWCDKAWRRMRNAERGEARLYQIGDKVYWQLYVVLEGGMEGYFTARTTEGVVQTTYILNVKPEKSWNVLDIS